MKLLFLFSLFISLSLKTYANQKIQQCDPTSKSQVKYEDKFTKTNIIQGEAANQAWAQSPAPTVDAQSDQFSGMKVYHLRVKQSLNSQCWSYQPAQLVNGIDIGPANCDAYFCEITESK